MNIDKKFKNYKRAKKRLVEEMNLDGEEQEVVSTSIGSDENVEDENDIAEEPEDLDSDIEKVEDEEEINSDDTEDDFEGGNDGTSDENVEANLADVVSNLTTVVQDLMDQVAKLKEGGDSEEEPVDNFDMDMPEDDFGGEDSSENSESTEGTEESSENSESSEGTEESSDNGESSEGTEESSEEDDDYAGDDETKSEAYNYYRHKGRCLHEKSDYITSIILEGRFDKLEEPIMAVVKSKLRRMVDEAKLQIKEDAKAKKFGK